MVAKLSGKSVDEMAANFAAVRPIEEVVSGVRGVKGSFGDICSREWCRAKRKSAKSKDGKWQRSVVADYQLAQVSTGDCFSAVCKTCARGLSLPGPRSPTLLQGVQS
jgi:hypothetical protein